MPRYAGETPAQPESSETSVDSDAVEDVDSDIENSRVVGPSPEIQSSRPDSSSTPRKPQLVPSDQHHLRSLKDSLHTQVTQHVNPLTASQMRAILGDDEDYDDETRDETREAQVSTSFIPEGHSEHILSTSEGEDEGPKLLSSHREPSRRSMPANVALDLVESMASRSNSNIVTPTEPSQSRAPSNQVGGLFARNEPTQHGDSIETEAAEAAAEADAKARYRAGSKVSASASASASAAGVVTVDNGVVGRAAGAVIDETPVKVLAMPSTNTSPFVFVLVQWSGSPHWWPARCEQGDWQARKTKARVLFRHSEFGDVDLRHKMPVLYELKPNDVIRVFGRPAKTKFEVVACGLTTIPGGSLFTNDGFNVIKVRNEVSEFSVDAEDIYLTRSDMQAWRARRERERDRDLQQDQQQHYSEMHGNAENRDISNTTAINTTTLASFQSHPPQTDVYTPTNNFKRRSAGRGENQQLATPRKRRPRSAALTDPDSEVELELDSEPENYNLKSSPVASPLKRKRNSRQHEGLNVQDVSTKNESLFKRCVFSISTHDTQSAKIRARSLLIEHGARVLDEGLSELVKLTEISDGDTSSMPDLEYDFGDANFAAVLADEPRRTLKYLEMVAIGWPCLSVTYMYDCIAQNRMLDWQPYLLPAGDSNLVGKKMTVSLNTSAFYQRWIRDVSLNEQFGNRKVTFRCTAPLCVIVNRDTFKSNLVLLASLSAPRFRLWFYSSKRDVPEGAILLDLKPTTNMSKEIKRTDPGILDQLQNYAAAENSVIKNTEWMIQCIINGGLV